MDLQKLAKQEGLNFPQQGIIDSSIKWNSTIYCSFEMLWTWR